MRKTYRELIKLDTWGDRYAYLKLYGNIGRETFGPNRGFNQDFYSSWEWRRIRDEAIARDLGRDLAMEGFEIQGKIYVHHLNPITIQDLLDGRDYLLSLDNLVCVSDETHRLIHYGKRILNDYKPRTENDTIPWR